MYLGRIVELADADELYRNPRHPYTQALLSAVPIPDPVCERRGSGSCCKGEVPSPDRVYPGCPFADRCPIAEQHCREWPRGWKAPGTSFRATKRSGDRQRDSAD